jgi:hypothetical protein
MEMKREEIMTHVITWMSLRSIILNNQCQSQVRHGGKQL